jgi:hypothetical protein
MGYFGVDFWGDSFFFFFTLILFHSLTPLSLFHLSLPHVSVAVSVFESFGFFFCSVGVWAWRT